MVYPLQKKDTKLVEEYSGQLEEDPHQVKFKVIVGAGLEEISSNTTNYISFHLSKWKL